MKTQGEIESSISECMGRFEREYMGRGPKEIHTFLITDLVVVRLNGVLTPAEQHLVTALPNDPGNCLLKQVRTHLINLARPTLGAMIEGITDVKVACMHYDICAMTDEEVVLFSLAGQPICRELKNDHPMSRAEGCKKTSNPRHEVLS